MWLIRGRKDIRQERNEGLDRTDGREVETRRQQGVLVVVAVIVVVAVVARIRILLVLATSDLRSRCDVCDDGEEDAHDAHQPDDEVHADVGTGVDAAAEFTAVSLATTEQRDELGNIPASRNTNQRSDPVNGYVPGIVARSNGDGNRQSKQNDTKDQ